MLHTFYQPGLIKNKYKNVWQCLWFNVVSVYYAGRQRRTVDGRGGGSCASGGGSLCWDWLRSAQAARSLHPSDSLPGLDLWEHQDVKLADRPVELSCANEILTETFTSCEKIHFFLFGCEITCPVYVNQIVYSVYLFKKNNKQIIKQNLLVYCFSFQIIICYLGIF